MRTLTRPQTFDAVVRVSRVNGREGDAFMSPKEQIAAIKTRAERDGVVIAKWWNENDMAGDNVSAGTVEREGLNAAIDRAVKGKTDGILVAKVDRFARTVMGGLSAMLRLEDAGRQLWSAREGVIVGDEKATATDKLIRTFWLMLAQWQRDTLAEGWESVRHRHIKNGVHTQEPYGFAKHHEPGCRGKKCTCSRHLVAREDEAPWVPLIFDRRAEGTSWADLCDWLTAGGATPRGGGSAWSISSVKQIVESCVYLGEIRSGDIVNKKAHTPLVSLDQWTRANSVVTTTGAKRDAEPYMLTGVIRCASCGVRMFGLTDRWTNAKGDEVVRRYYRCRGRHGAWGRCPGPARILADEVEAIVDREFRAAFLADKVAVPTEATGEVEAAEAELRAANAELEAFVVAAEALQADLFARGLSARQGRLDAAEVAVAAARSAALGVSHPAGLAKVWGGYSVAEKKPYIAEAFAVVAVARGREPAADRVCTWLAGDPATPSPLPGVEGCSTLTPITLR